MLSSKLKSWMESHLTRKKSSGSNSKKSASGYHGGGGTTTTSSGGSYKELSPADRIAHPASSLVNLVPAVPLCSTSGRSNAGLVIRLQNDFREQQQHSSAQSPCHLVRHQQQHHHHHPSWTRSPVMLAWNTKIPPPPPTPTIPLKDPPLSPPPSSSSSTIIQQSGEPSPTGSDWTSKSFADESGIGGSRTDNREGGSLSSSSKANTTTGSSIGGTADFPHHHHHESRRMNAPSLSSPESAYSTGCSADGVSPSQDGMFDGNFNQPLTAAAALLLDPIWRRSTLEADASGSNSTSSTQSPRTRPAIRTNPWLPVRTSLTSAGSTTSDRVSWMTDSTPEAALSEMCPPPVKETDIVASSSSSAEEEDSDPVAAAMAACAANDELDQLCDSLQLLMDGDRLRVIATQPMKTTVAPLVAYQSPAPDRRRWEATAVDVDDQYTLLIRQTEEILLQLEKDELLLASRKNLNQAEENELSHPVSSSSAAANRSSVLHPVVKGSSNNNNNNNSRPCSASSASGLQPQRRRLRKTAASRRRRCSSSSRNSALVYSSSSSSSSSSESSDCEYLDSNNRRMLSATTSASDWNASRRPRSVNRNNSLSKGITPRFASRQNVRVLPHPPQQQQQQQQPLPVPPPPPRDCWILSSQRTSCSPDDWTTEHDRPPSPAPLDPHCHWSSVAHPSVQLRNAERMMTPTRSPSISSCSSNSRRNSRQFRDVRQQQQRHHHHQHHQISSGPTSPAIRLDWDDDYHHQTTTTTTTTNSSSCSSGGPAGRRWRQSMTREQQRLESQIAFLRRQLKDVTDDYYDYDRGGPSSSASDSSPRRLK